MTQNETSSTHLGQLDPQAIVEHYARLALLPGWIDHARYQIDIMQKHPTGMYKGIGKAVAQRIKELK
jgi:hypothetical protein